MNALRVKQWAERVMRTRNSDVAATMKFKWVQPPVLQKYPTGVMGWAGAVVISAPGFRTRKMIVDADDTGIRIA